MSDQGANRPTRLLYYEDAYIREFDARIVAVQESNGNRKLILDQTAFYPMGGGQPADIGIIEAPVGKAEIKDVRIENQVVMHITGDVKGTMPVGAAVKGNIDWNRRYQLMRNHTLAHLMAEAIRKATMLPIEIAGSGLDVDKARLDLAHEGSLGPMLPEIEKVANDLIKENRPVEIKTMPRARAEEYVTRFHESLKTLPPQVQNVRIVEIKGWHACACGGTHVKQTSEIDAAEILGRMSKGKGVQRIEFRAKTS